MGAAIVIPFFSVVGIALYLTRMTGGRFHLGPVGGRFGPDYKRNITEWLKKNINDPDGMEILEWSEPQRVAKDGKPEQFSNYYIVTVKYRAKNKFGAKEITYDKFKVYDKGDVYHE